MLAIFPKNTFMHKFTPVKEVLASLARVRPKDFVKEDNSINQTELAKFLGVGQPLISRALKEDEYELSRDTAFVIASKFRITMSQARGESPLRGKDLVPDAPSYGIIASEAASIIDDMPTTSQKALLTLIREWSKSILPPDTK